LVTASLAIYKCNANLLHLLCWWQPLLLFIKMIRS